MNPQIVLNCVTPFSPDFPSAALSVLKSYLKQHGLHIDILYWNLIFYDMQNEYLWNNIKHLDGKSILYLFFNYLAIHNDNKYIYKNLKRILMAINPKYITSNPEYYDTHMRLYAQKVEDILDLYISKYDLSQIGYFGFSLKLDQWIVASIIASKLKKQYPSIKIVVGGINTKASAVAFLDNFSQFDIAMWGEGEISLLELSNQLLRQSFNLDSIGNIAYKGENGDILVSTSQNNMHFVDLSQPEFLPYYDDYFQQRQKHKVKLMKSYLNEYGDYLPLEGSRGCHWNRCHFCFLNNGYKYRVKSINKLKSEIYHMIEKHNIYVFEFLDSDLVGRDINRFCQLLDALIEIRMKEPNFKIVMAEIITLGIDKETVSKMAQAGIVSAQIGYESPSNNLLKKIDKKNTFASNLFFIKMAILYKIRLGGVNVIVNLLEENNDDILEAIDNLKFLRFFLSSQKFRHNMSPLVLGYDSRYYKYNKESFVGYTTFTTIDYLLKDYVKSENHIHLFEFINKSSDLQWENFRLLEKHYLNNNYNYQIEIEGKDYVYKEKVNGQIIDRFILNSIMIDILQYTNDQVLSLKELIRTVNSHSIDKITMNSLVKNLMTLYNKGLVFCSKDYKEIVSVLAYKS